MKQLLNERQLSVLQWVERECPDGVWETSSYKISCQALQNRGLLKVSKRQGQWSATLTSAGRHYLQHGNYPPAQPQARRTTPVQKPTPAVPAVSTGIAAAEPAAPAVPSKAPQAPQTRKTVTEQLLEELAEAGGRIVKSTARGPNAVNWAARVSAARRSGRIPKTKELYGGWCREGYEIRLMDIPAWRLAVLEPIAVPAGLTQPHAVVRALQSQSPPMGLTKAVQARALRLVQALITATRSRGHSNKIGATRGGAPLPHRRRSVPPHFTITAQGQECGFLVIQEQDRSEHTPTEKELAEAKKYSWVKIPRFDYTPADRLRIIVSGGQPHRAGEWADTADHSLEDQLAEIVQEVNLRGEAAERKRLADLEAAKQKRLRWEAAMRQARAEYAEAYRVKHLEAQEEAWRRATRLAEYLSAARRQVETLPDGQEKDEAEVWIAWADAHVEHLNPLNTPPRLPKVPEPRTEDLKPFLHGWSPYGPNSY